MHMAAASQYSTEYTVEKAAPAIVKQATSELSVFALKFTVPALTVSVAATYSLYLRRLPAGKVWFFPLKSRIRWSAGGSSQTFDIGYGAYYDYTNTLVAASLAKYDNDVDSSSAGAAYLGSDYTDTTGEYDEFFSRDGVDIQLLINTTDAPVGQSFEGTLWIARP
jgi:hypothetical protein